MVERDRIRAQYLDLTGRELLADIGAEFSGAELLHAKMLFHQGRLEPEDELFLAMAGLGTDDATVFRVIDPLGGNPAAIADMEARFWDKYSDHARLWGRHSGEAMGLIDILRGDLGGADYDRVIGVLGPVLGDVSFVDCDDPAVRTEIRSFHPDAYSWFAWEI